MMSTKYFLTVTFFLLFSECIYGATKPRPPISNPDQAAQINDLSRKIDRLDQRLTTLQRDTDGIKKTNRQLSIDITAANEEIDKINSRNEGLQEMLGQFEKFFGVLYSEGEYFDNPVARSVDKKINLINQYVSDREAELVGLNPNILYTKLGVEHEEVETNVSVDTMGKAVLQLADSNQKMQNRVIELEAKVVEVTKDTASRGTDTNIINDEVTQERLETLEAAVNQMLIDQAKTSPGARSAADQEAFEDAIIGLDARSATTSRKSVFSVARTAVLYGGSTEQVITFDHTYVNKGGDFRKENGTFICEWTGYYFFSLTVRSLDHHYIGVNLMKTKAVNNQNEVVTAIYTDSDQRNVMESQTVALHLQSGDRVWLRLGPSDQFAIYSDDYRYITFSGFLIYKGN